MRRLPSPARTFLLSGLSCAYLLVAGEAFCRFVDGYRFDSVALEPRAMAAPMPEDPARDRVLLEQVTFDPSAKSDWFFLPPAALDKPINPELAQRSKLNQDLVSQENFIWNDALLRDPPDGIKETLRRQNSRDLFAFPSYDGSAHPPFRLYPDAQLPFWTTNHFGWISADVEVAKPKDTIRIGILGDSTSHNTYGLYLQAFLDAWARAEGVRARFEVLNTARQGIGLTDSLAVLRFELAPMSLDYAYLSLAPGLYYQGTQLWMNPKGADPAKAEARPRASGNLAVGALGTTTQNSDLARHLLAYLNNRLPGSVEREPAKPRIKLRFPFNRRGTPMLSVARSVPYYGWYLGELDRFKQLAVELDVAPLISTERICAYPDMAINRSTNPYLFDHLNGPVLWPLSYRDMQHLLWFNNQVIKTWASQNGVGIVDLERWVPKLPELCVDAFHDPPLGQRLRAWIIFQSLLPTIHADLASGRLPRSGASSSDNRHPYLDRPIVRLDREAVIKSLNTARAN